MAKYTLRRIADDILLREPAEAGQLAAQSTSRSKALAHLTGDLRRNSSKDDQELGQLYEITDRLRIGAKDAQNYLNRSMMLSRAFVPLIQGAYPCAGSKKALQLAHGLHLSIGNAKGVIGSAPNAIPDGSQGEDSSSLSRLGVADLATGLEAKLGKITSAGGKGSMVANMSEDAKIQTAGIPFEAILVPSATPLCADGREASQRRDRQFHCRERLCNFL
eukprot:TRINITY_DN27656_c0_g1_i2.p1 TRINITY_DN27656_c0_g1~~TRINITY_DN27656_c0_g1_i2.p1  ORF type:complete len:219 (+),score=28.76 TRINITY_DN27656_c0_g1_i2:42-698(+)